MSGGSLDGVRVLELGGIGPGPFAGMVLADMGADVVHIDRVAPLVPAAVQAGSARTAALTQGKRVIELDLRSAAGAEVGRGLAARAHILIEGFRPGVAERLGFGPEQLWGLNPRLVYGRMTGWGQSGPWAQVAGHDINYTGLTGALHAIGRVDQPPSVPLILVGDFGGGAMFLVAEVLAALRAADRTGHGQLVDVAIVDGVARMMTPFYAAAAAGEWRDERGVNQLDSGRPWYDVYATSDGRWMSVGALEDQFYAEFVRLLELGPDVSKREDPDGWPALRAAIAARFASRSRAEWEQVFDGTDACVAPVLTMAEAAVHPQLAARGIVAAARDGAAAVPQSGEQSAAEILASWD